MNKEKYIFSASEKNYMHSSSDAINTLLSFLEDFDPIKMKYGVLNGELPAAIMDTLCEYESMFKYGELVKQKYSSILENLKLVYGDDKLIKKT